MSIFDTDDDFVLDILSGAMQPVQNLLDIIKTLKAQLVETRKRLDETNEEFVALQASFEFLGVTPEYAHYTHGSSPECCTFLGKFTQVKEHGSGRDSYQENVLYDLYYHSELDNESLIARYGDGEDEYLEHYCVAVFLFNDPNDPLFEARRRARLLRLSVPN